MYSRCVIILLTLSLGCNVILFISLRKKELFAADQIIARFHVEQLLRSYDVDLSYNTVKYRFDHMNRLNVRELETKEISGLVISDFDHKAIAVDDTVLLFKSGNYAASQTMINQ